MISKQNQEECRYDKKIVCFLPLKNIISVCFFSPLHSYEFQVKPKNPLGEGPPSNTVAFSTESGNHISSNS